MRNGHQQLVLKTHKKNLILLDFVNLFSVFCLRSDVKLTRLDGLVDSDQLLKLRFFEQLML